MKATWELVKQAGSGWLADLAPSMGAALSYYTLFSLAPLLVVVIAVAGLLFDADVVRSEVFAQLTGLIGEESAAGLRSLIGNAARPLSTTPALIVGTIASLIGATTVFAELQTDLDRIWRAPPRKESGVLSLVRHRVIAFGMVLAIGFLLLVSLVITAALSALGKWWSGWFAELELLLQGVNFVGSFALVTLLFAMIYKILPRVKIEWSDVWIGSAVTSLMFTVGKSAIGFYLGRSDVAAGYGAAGSVVVLLIWVYYAAQIFLFGAEFTFAYAQSHGSQAESRQRSVLRDSRDRGSRPALLDIRVPVRDE